VGISDFVDSALVICGFIGDAFGDRNQSEYKWKTFG